MKKENSDWNDCIDDNGSKLGRCINACNNNVAIEWCEDQCLNQFKFRQSNCPCEVKCLIPRGDTMPKWIICGKIEKFSKQIDGFLFLFLFIDYHKGYLLGGSRKIFVNSYWDFSTVKYA